MRANANWGSSKLPMVGRCFSMRFMRLSLSAQIARRFGTADVSARWGDGAAQSRCLRVIAATNRDLKAMAQGKEFRGDLFARLNAITVELPPLRERPDDIGLLAEHFLHQAVRITTKLAAIVGKPRTC